MYAEHAKMKYIWVLLLLCSFSYSIASEATCKSWLVQSIPTDMPELKRVPGVLSSGDVLRWIAGNSSGKLDIIAQYWELLAQPNNPESADYGYSAADLERLRAPIGLSIFKSLQRAADRNVSIRGNIMVNCLKLPRRLGNEHFKAIFLRCTTYVQKPV